MISSQEVIEQLVNIKPSRETQWPKALWRASSLGKCMRLQTLNALGTQILVTPRQERLFTIHNSSHEAVQSMIKDSFNKVRLEHAFVDEELHVSGHIDAIITDGERPVVVEVKTLNSFFAKRVRAWYNGEKDATEPYWTQQVNLYRHHVTNSPDFSGDAIGVSLVCTDDGVVTPFIEEENNDFLNELEVLLACWRTKTVPPRSGKSGFLGCDECPLKHICSEPYEMIDDFVDHAKSYLMENRMAILKEDKISEA